MNVDDKTRMSPRFETTKVGTQLSGIYELDERIGCGGMGEVYRGHNIQTGDPVAIKIVLPEFASDPTILSLFRKEASVLNHLSHDAIVRYHVFTIDPGIARPYLAMEFVDGEALSEVIRQGPMGEADVRKLCHRLASGLSAVHEAGAIHRDLSPDNIILPGRRVERAKIIDFGIARANVGGGTLIDGRFAGKYNYVSPEQLGLFGGEVREQSDIYSLGLVLAAALRGKPLDMGGSHFEVVEKRQTVPDLSGIGGELRHVIEAMLQPDPRNRAASMAEIAKAMGAAETVSMLPWNSYGSTGAPARSTALTSSDDRPRFVPHIPPALPSVSSPQVVERSARPPAARAQETKKRPTIAILAAAAVLAGAAYLGTYLLARSPVSTSDDPRVSAPSGPLAADDTVPGAASSDKKAPHAAEQDESSAQSSGQVTAPPQGKAAEQGQPADTENRPTVPSPPLSQEAGTQREGGDDAGVVKADKLVEKLLAPERSEAEDRHEPAPSGNANTAGDAAPSAGHAAEAQPNPPHAPEARVGEDPQLAGKNVDARAARPEAPGPLSQAQGERPKDTESESNNSLGLDEALVPPPPEPATGVDARVEQEAASGETADPAPSPGREESASDGARDGGGSADDERTPSVVTMNVPGPDAPSAVISARLRWLGGYSGGRCFYATPTSLNEAVVEIEGFGEAVQPFVQMMEAFRNEFGIEPDIGVRVVNPAQCEAVEFLRAIDAAGAEKPLLALDHTSISSGTPLTGTLTARGGLWSTMLLIDDTGMVFNLADRIRDQANDAAFSVPVSLDAADKAAGKEVPLVLVVVAGPTEITAASFSDPTPAAVVFPKILAEIRKSNLQFSATAKYFRLGG